jgi:hypothetical protein
MPSRQQFLLKWPRSVPTKAECDAALRFREGNGILKATSISNSIPIYITSAWDTETEKIWDGSSTALPGHYRHFWDQLNYIVIYYQQVYMWLSKWLEDKPHGHRLLRKAIQAHAKWIIYSTKVQDSVKQILKNEVMTSWTAETRIKLFDEWIVKDQWNLHNATQKVLASSKSLDRFKLDPFKDGVEFGEKCYVFRLTPTDVTNKQIISMYFQRCWLPLTQLRTLTVHDWAFSTSTSTNICWAY